MVFWIVWEIVLFVLKLVMVLCLLFGDLKENVVMIFLSFRKDCVFLVVFVNWRKVGCWLFCVVMCCFKVFFFMSIYLSNDLLFLVVCVGILFVWYRKWIKFGWLFGFILFDLGWFEMFVILCKVIDIKLWWLIF